MFKHTEVFSLMIAALLILTVGPGTPTKAPRPESLIALSNAEAAESSRSALSLALTEPSVSSVQANGETLEFVGHIGGITEAVLVEDAHAYIGEGPRLTILDVSTPGAPAILGKTSPLPGVVRDIALAGEYAYVATISGDNPSTTDSISGLQIVDVSEPTNPSEVAFYPTADDAHSVAVAGGFAYVAAEESGLRVLDISTPPEPIEVGFLDTLETAESVVVDGNHAYVAAGSSGLWAVDVSTPSNPTQVGFYDVYATGGLASDVVVKDGYAYVTAEGYPGSLLILDASVPSNLSEIGSCTMTGFALAVAVLGDYAFVADGARGGVQMVDVSSPSNPVQVGDYRPPGAAVEVAAAGSYVYVADCDSLRVVDVSVPGSMTELGSYVTGGTARDVALSGGYAYVANGRNLQVVDVSVPADPMQVAVHDIEAGAADVTVVENHAYVADGGFDLFVIDISSPSNPMEIGYYEAPAGGEPNPVAQVAVSGDVACMASGWLGLQVIDVSDPAAPRDMGIYNTTGWTYAVDVTGRHAYVGGESSLTVVDVLDPGGPRQVGTYLFYDRVHGVTVFGSRVFVSHGPLTVLDVSDPSNPTWWWDCYPPGEAEGATVAEGQIFYTAGRDGLHVVLVRGATFPQSVSYDTPGDATAVTVVGNHAYVADGSGGLVILRFLRDSVVESIPSSGGSLSSSRGDTTVVFPSGAFTAPVSVTYRHLWRDGNTGRFVDIDHTFELTAVYSDTGEPAQLAPGKHYTTTVAYGSSGAAIEDTLGLYWWDKDTNAWSQQGITSSVNVTDDVVTAQVDHFSRFAVLGETNRIYLPLVLRNQ